MVANSLESMGIQTKVYMTRFVVLNDISQPRPRIGKNLKTGELSPMYPMILPDSRRRGQLDSLFIQPIPAKQYGEDLDLLKALMYGRQKGLVGYEPIAKEALKMECTNNPYLYGQPDWEATDYLEGFDRFRQKYKLYTDMGIWKSKEVKAEGMIFFHDMTLRDNIPYFLYDITSYYDKRGELAKSDYNEKESEALSKPDANAFFNWWMISSANTIKHKVDLLNSDNRIKTLQKIDSDLRESKYEVDDIIAKTQDKKLADIFIKYSDIVMNTLQTKNIQLYILKLTSELTTYAQDAIFPTEQDRVKAMDDFAEAVIKDLINF